VKTAEEIAPNITIPTTVASRVSQFERRLLNFTHSERTTRGKVTARLRVSNRAGATSRTGPGTADSVMKVAMMVLLGAAAKPGWMAIG
jgi:hypothetical protein